MHAGLVFRGACLLFLPACLATQPARSSWNPTTGQVECTLTPTLAATGFALSLGSFGAAQLVRANQPPAPPPSDGMIHIGGPDADTYRAIGYAALGAAAVAVAVSAIEGTTYGRCRSLERPLQELYGASDCATVTARLDDIGSVSPGIRRKVIESNVRFSACAAAAGR